MRDELPTYWSGEFGSGICIIHEGYMETEKRGAGGISYLPHALYNDTLSF